MPATTFESSEIIIMLQLWYIGPTEAILTHSYFSFVCHAAPLVIVIDPFTKRHGLVHNGGFPKFEALYCSSNMISSTEIS